jgi:moderate conductance mechanosensitive channel
MTWPDLTLIQQWLIAEGLQIVGVIVVAVVARWLLHRTIKRVVAAVTERNARRDHERPQRALSPDRQYQRVTTLGSLLRSIVTFTIATLAVLTVMAILGVPLGPVLASAGVGGVALGFGAQSLVKDFLSGIFMIFEDQYGVGDVIDTGEAIGTVEEVGLRVTRLRDASGVLWYIRNGEIVRIGNRSQGWSTATVDASVSYAENAERVIGLIEQVCREFDADPDWADRLLEKPDVVGVESITGTTMTIRTFAKCAPNQNFAVQRELRERIKAALDAAGVAPPPPPLLGSAPQGREGQR